MPRFGTDHAIRTNGSIEGDELDIVANSQRQQIDIGDLLRAENLLRSNPGMVQERYIVGDELHLNGRGQQ